MTSPFTRRVSIVALQGAPSATIQRLLADVAASRAREGFRVGGVVEMATPAPGGACGRLALRDLATGALFPISQDLGPASTSCNLDPGGIAAACKAIEDALERGVDLIVISKFGKQEAARGGLADAFRAAVTAQVPIMTAVSPALADAWNAFAGPLADYLPADRQAVEYWWQDYLGGTAIAAAV